MGHAENSRLAPLINIISDIATLPPGEVLYRYRFYVNPVKKDLNEFLRTFWHYFICILWVFSINLILPGSTSNNLACPDQVETASLTCSIKTSAFLIP